MDVYLKQFREMISLRGLTDHTIVSYSTYIRVYLDYLSHILHKMFPAILSAMRLALTFMKMAPTCSPLKPCSAINP